ncbi:MAG: acetylornithine deacetylase/succinyl-diaminopimelate desuccinylase family protein [Albidovulum sp.]|nr:acetylornithine deacetylase/succinyl-diaminopimelate desuccinylase family protein [Albidovulum sp.]
MLIERILSEIADRREELVDLTRELVAIPTLNPPGENYLAICDFLGSRLKRSGFAVELLRAEGAPADSDRHPRWNIVARREGFSPGECVHFNSHTDVVAVGHDWTVDPFGGKVKDGRIYGRGSCDMKGGLAASIIAAEAFVARCPRFRGAIEISGTADEESGGYGGVAWLAERGYFSPPRVHHVIIPEPLNKNRICLGHRGLWWAELETRGRIAHGSMPFLGECAVRHMSAIISEMEENLFPKLAARRTEMPVVPEGARQSTLNINSIHGGEPVQEEGYGGFPASCVPDKCRIVLDRRFLAEEPIREVKQEIRSLVEKVAARRQGFNWNLREFYEVEPVATEREAPVARAVDAAIERVIGTKPDYVMSPGTYDQKHIDRIGKLKNCIAYGPGILDLAHQPDEWIGIDDMLDSAGVMALAIASLLGER